jgi:hypothetical protein
VDLARLWRSQNRITDAHELLARANASFTELFDFPDLIKARVLLAELDTASSN